MSRAAGDLLQEARRRPVRPRRMMRHPETRADVDRAPAANDGRPCHPDRGLFRRVPPQARSSPKRTGEPFSIEAPIGRVAPHLRTRNAMSGTPSSSGNRTTRSPVWANGHRSTATAVNRVHASRDSSSTAMARTRGATLSQTGSTFAAATAGGRSRFGTSWTNRSRWRVSTPCRQARLQERRAWPLSSRADAAPRGRLTAGAVHLFQIADRK